MVPWHKNRLVYLMTSFILFLVAPLLVSIGTTRGPRVLLWIGFAALCIGALIPPLRRLVAPDPPPQVQPNNEPAGSSRKEGEP